jgi:hypothetical protein
MLLKLLGAAAGGTQERLFCTRRLACDNPSVFYCKLRKCLLILNRSELSVNGAPFAAVAEGTVVCWAGPSSSRNCYGAAELLNRLRWDSYPEKILLLGAWFEARGGSVPWKSADMDEVFKQAKEKPPANFPRDVKQAIKAAWIHPVTPRTYSVTRTGWNKLAEVLSQ